MTSNSDSSFIRKWAEKQQKLTQEPILSVVVPAYNEALRIPATLLETSNYLRRAEIQFEICVVDDGSTDSTAEVVKRFSTLVTEVRLIQLSENSGKGAAIKKGLAEARGKLILCIDADGATPIAELDKLLPHIERGKCEIAFGSRAIFDDETEVKASIHRKCLGRIFNLAVNLLLVRGVKDTQCGFKLFSQKAARFLASRQRCNNFAFDVELLHIAQKCEIPFKEVAINWTDIPGTKVNVIRDGLKMFLELFRIRKNHLFIKPADYSEFINSAYE